MKVLNTENKWFHFPLFYERQFRFILNQSKAIVTNSYLIIYPKPDLENAINENPNLDKLLIEALNKITGKAMVDEGIVYGGRMYKLEPKELANVAAVELQGLLSKGYK